MIVKTLSFSSHLVHRLANVILDESEKISWDSNMNLQNHLHKAYPLGSKRYISTN